MHYKGRPLYCSIPDRARKRRRDVLHAELRYCITCRPHGNEGTDRLDRLCNRKFSRGSALLRLSDFCDAGLGDGEKVRNVVSRVLLSRG